MKTILGLASLGVALLSGGCATGGAVSPAGEDAAPGHAVVVENRGMGSVGVYAVRNNARLRIGQVPGMTTQRLVLKRGMVSAGGTVQFLLRGIGGGEDVLSAPMQVVEGRAIRLNVGGRLSAASFADIPGWP